MSASNVFGILLNSNEIFFFTKANCRCKSPKDQSGRHCRMQRTWIEPLPSSLHLRDTNYNHQQDKSGVVDPDSLNQDPDPGFLC